MKAPGQKNPPILSLFSAVQRRDCVGQLIRVGGKLKLRIYDSKAAAIKAGANRDDVTSRFAKLQRGVTTQDLKCHIPVIGTDGQLNVTAACEPSSMCDGECHVFMGDPGTDLSDMGAGPVKWPNSKIAVCVCVQGVQP
jgi:hypothetical protein